MIPFIEALADEVENKGDVNVALIIGATGGIGSVTAELLASHGYDLIIHYHKNKEKANELKKRLENTYSVQVIIVQANILRHSEVSEMFKTIKRHFAYISAFINTSTSHFGAMSFSKLEWSDINLRYELMLRGIIIY